MAQFLKVLKNLVFLVVLAIGVYLFAAVVLGVLKTHPHKMNCENTTAIFVSSNGVHLDVIIPLKNLDKEFAKQLKLARGTQFVAFGWGDKNFYIYTPEWKDLTLPTAFKALFLKSECAMHVTSYGKEWAGWKKTTLCPEQLNALQIYISKCFKKDAMGMISPIGIKGYGYNDKFYDAHGSFSLFNTCNVWVNRALKEAGVETSLWSPFDFGVLYHLP